MFSINILLRARLGQWFGMTLVAGVGYLVYELTEDGFGAETAAVLSSFAIGLTGTVPGVSKIICSLLKQAFSQMAHHLDAKLVFYILVCLAATHLLHHSRCSVA